MTGREEAADPRFRGGRFGHSELPRKQADALRRARLLEVVTLAYMSTVVVVVALTMGSSQAMRTAWVEDLLALVPPLAFLVACHWSSKRPTAEHPYEIGRAHV